MKRRRYRHEWEDLAFVDSDFIGGWGAFDSYDGPLEFDGLTPSKAHGMHDAERDTFTIVYATKDDDGTLPVCVPVKLLRQRCTYDKPDNAKAGRVYFEAPCCRRRVRKLALLPSGIRCGRCGSITYRSKRKSGIQRLIHKADLLAGRLECANWYSPPKERPKGMRRETFNRLADEHAALVQEAMRVVRPRIMRAVGRAGIAGQMMAALRYGM